jgi:hypothetical protein
MDFGRALTFFVSGENRVKVHPEDVAATFHIRFTAPWPGR